MGGNDNAEALHRLETALGEVGEDLAVFLVFERPSQVEARPALAKTFFAERCSTDEHLAELVSAFREVGAYVEVFEGEKPFLRALTTGRLSAIGRSHNVVYSGIGFGITTGGYEPGRMAMLPAVADSYGILCANSGAYTCALAKHSFHSFVLLKALGVQVAPTWHYSAVNGWMGEAPPLGTKVIAKSTYEAWSVGVTDDSVFHVDNRTEQRLTRIAESIGQAVTMQKFIAGREVCVPLVEVPDLRALAPIEQVLTKAPGDPNSILTIHDNLAANGFDYIPFDGPAEVAEQMQATAKSVFRIFQQRSIGRMDFRIDQLGRPFLTDAAIMPALDKESSMYEACRGLGLTHSQFLRAVLATSLLSRGLIKV